jgi:hypothetical protein
MWTNVAIEMKRDQMFGRQRWETWGIVHDTKKSRSWKVLGIDLKAVVGKARNSRALARRRRWICRFETRAAQNVIANGGNETDGAG